MSSLSPPPSSSSSRTQYDAIGLSYESLKRLPAAQLERENLRATIEPLLSLKKAHDDNSPDVPAGDGDGDGVTVLDLACGTGYYSRLLLEWGAARVVGVDISEKMVDAAREQSKSRVQGLEETVVADGASGAETRDGPGMNDDIGSDTAIETEPNATAESEQQKAMRLAREGENRNGPSWTMSGTGPSCCSRSPTKPDSRTKHDTRPTTRRNRLSFHVGDCTQPLRLPSSLRSSEAEIGSSSKPKAESSSEPQFDIILGAWLLNYASIAAEMTSMFANIARHLKPGGHFVGITPYPAEDLDAFATLVSQDLGDQGHNSGDVQAQDSRSFRNPQDRHLQEKSTPDSTPTKYGVTVTYKTKLHSNEGYATRVTAHVSPVRIQFDNYHLRREVYERSARQAGLYGPLEWREVRLPTPHDSVVEYGVTPDFWDGYLEAPHFGILVIEKHQV
ncbi:hypothetical protein A1O1_01904 [Capronia coronata CBS 617.96]|uniref:Methyltransferase domain-containing protein n=1 Tax=Capronia coronata CBS 617.96 TaxID=1182541 RepID=W9YKT1_9EURO|nr:uncharacterized protein A1O1_01904 [Capronia coronata CBS 617.96]EXJ93512.1 hypothetical protein A1O1_01904 [Capronia coronata CBS 617.96]